MKANHVSAFGRGVHRIMQLKKMEETVTLDIQWSRELLQDMFPEGHTFHWLITDFDSVYPTLIGEPYRIIDDRLKEIIHELIFTPYPDDIREEIEQSRVEDYLLHILNLSQKELTFERTIDKMDLKKVNKAIELINAKSTQTLNYSGNC